MTRMVQRTVAIDEAQLARLHALSSRTQVPMGVYIREGLGRVLSLAETQMGTLAVLKKLQEAQAHGEDR